jgi:hypothetical protein
MTEHYSKILRMAEQNLKKCLSKILIITNESHKMTEQFIK